MIKTITADGKTEYEALSSLAGRGDAGADAAVETAVRAIIADVRLRGDAAVREYGLKYDGFLPERLTLTRDDMKAGYDAAPRAFTAAILHAAENIRAYHGKQVQRGYEEKRADGTVIGQMIRGMDRVGLYVPGGTAAYPSTVLMNAIPAKLAGVGELIMATPPRQSGGSGLTLPAEILAAAYVSGVDRIVLAGGAQAVAALAYGTDAIPKVDKIVGPGNVYVATAKRELYGLVDIDMIAGPSEILIIADSTGGLRAPDAQSARLPEWIAADMLSQAEHDTMAASILLTTDGDLAGRVAAAIETQLEELEREDIARKSVEGNGLIVVCRSEDEMIDIADAAAPEHLEILTEDPLGLVPRIKNAGSVFCGPYSPEPLGDYYAGTNHVLPTGGTARWASPLGVYDFVKRMSYTYYTEDALARARDDIIAIGEAEGLTAHVASVKKRFEP
jgi:histidinol dehydrogenase